MFLSGSRNTVGLPTVPRFQWMNPPALLQAGNSSIESSRSQPDVREPLNIFHHGVAVFVAISQARQHEKNWITHVYYAPRNIVRRSIGHVKRACLKETGSPVLFIWAPPSAGSLDLLKRRFEISETEVRVGDYAQVHYFRIAISPKGDSCRFVDTRLRHMPVTPHALTFDLSWAMLTGRRLGY